MKSLTCRLFYFLCLVGMTTTVIASEQRVLLSFDNAGHQVRKIVYPDSQRMLQPGTSEPTARQRSQIDVQALIATLQPGTARLIWKDDGGLVAADMAVPDPRILRAPAHIAGTNESLLGQDSGAWMIEGPQGATSVLILLPAHLSLGLAFEQWDVVLTL